MKCFLVFQKAILLWMYDPGTRDAVIVKEALSGDTIHLRRATEVLCSRTSTQIQHVRQIYLSMFQSYIEHDIEKSASGDHKKVRFIHSLSFYNIFLLFVISLIIINIDN